MEKENYNMLEIRFEARKRELALIDEEDKRRQKVYEPRQSKQK